MSVMIQIRNVPEATHRRLKSQAALSGQSLSDYLLAQVQAVAARPTLAELRERVERGAQTLLAPTPAEAVRAERDSR